MPTTDHMHNLIRVYFDGCNEADVEKISNCFVPDAVHYFPPGMYEGPFVGAATIARRWVQAVETLGSKWTIDQFIADPATGRAVVEWSHFKTATGILLRGDEWYRFDEVSGLIAEIRAYYASPAATEPAHLELGGFAYADRGYAQQPPVIPGRT